jgi:hypothetical protein
VDGSKFSPTSPAQAAGTPNGQKCPRTFDQPSITSLVVVVFAKLSMIEFWSKNMVRNLIIVVLIAVFLTACSSGSSPDQTVENYLQAVVDKDAVQVSSLSCGDWETSALMMMDSFQNVSAEIQDLTCAEAGANPDGMTVVSCTGKIVASYGDELQEFDLSVQDYLLQDLNGEWLVCGMQ